MMVGKGDAASHESVIGVPFSSRNGFLDVEQEHLIFLISLQILDTGAFLFNMNT